MRGNGSILKDTKEDIYLTYAFQCVTLFTTARLEVPREQTVLRFNLGTTTQIPLCSVPFWPRRKKEKATSLAVLKNIHLKRAV
jgi:hypothetical protein